MKKRFFSLIAGQPIHIAPNTKRIPADAFSELLDSKELRDRIQEDAEAYREKIVRECEEIKEKAYLDGYEEGFRQWVEKIAEMEQEREKVRGEIEQFIVPVALKGAQKIVGKELETSNETIVSIVANNLRAVAQHKKITVHVSAEDYQIIDGNRDVLKALFEKLESFTVVPREDLGRGDCIIETEGGIINAELPNLWSLLEQAFKQLLHERHE